MRRNLLQGNNYSWGKAIFANLICFAVVLIFSFGLCYAYFSERLEISGGSNLGVMHVMYCRSLADTAGTSVIFGSINGGTAQDISSIDIAPGDTLAIKGYAVNNGNIDVFVLGRLEVVATDANNETETEVVWYNISNGQSLYVEKGRFQVGASVLYSNGNLGDKQEINASYVFEGDRYINGYDISSVKFELFGYQAEFLDFSGDFDLDKRYDLYVTMSGNKKVYSEDSKKLVCHYITGRMLDVWKTADASATGLLSDLTTDNLGAYLINNCADWMMFKQIAQTQSNTQGKTFKLNCYLDFNNTTTAINLTDFYGNFDGQGYTISNVSATANGNWAVLGATHNSNIENLGVDGLKISVTQSGCVAGVVAIQNQGRVSNCFVIGASVYGSTGYDLVAPSAIATGLCVGGVVGRAVGDNSSMVTAIVSNCYAILSINAETGRCGGIVGQEYATLCKVENCYFKGEIGNSNSGGGICGDAGTYGTVENCYAVLDEFASTNSSNNVAGNDSITNTINCAYHKAGITAKVGQNQTEQIIDEATFKSVGKLRDAFGWATSIWSTDIYHSTNGLPVLRVFYNF